MSCLKAVRPVNVSIKKKKKMGGVGLVQKEQPRLSLTTLIRLAKNKRVGWVGGGGDSRQALKDPSMGSLGE